MAPAQSAQTAARPILSRATARSSSTDVSLIGLLYSYCFSLDIGYNAHKEKTMNESFDTLALLVAILSGVLNAYGMENIPGWAKLPALLKKAIVVAAAGLVPL